MLYTVAYVNSGRQRLILVTVALYRLYSPLLRLMRAYLIDLSSVQLAYSRLMFALSSTYI